MLLIAGMVLSLTVPTMQAQRVMPPHLFPKWGRACSSGGACGATNAISDVGAACKAEKVPVLSRSSFATVGTSDADAACDDTHGARGSAGASYAIDGTLDVNAVRNATEGTAVQARLVVPPTDHTGACGTGEACYATDAPQMPVQRAEPQTVRRLNTRMLLPMAALLMQAQRVMPPWMRVA
jgi:hypothetical protein